MQIVEAHSGASLPLVRELFVEYAAGLPISLCFQDFDRELSTLPGPYAPPAGRLLLALEENRATGCVALRKLAHRICEMKRLYVRPDLRRRGTGRALAGAVIDAARQLGYHSMRLDTLASMKAAIALYASLGFHPIDPYYQNPSTDAVFLELVLE
jgi:ribosomal protein S18 acetylase RimI-like enzyme